MSVSVNLSYVLIAYNEPWRADELARLVVALRPGIRTVQVNDGQAALRVCRKQPPSFLIADGELAQLDARNLLHELRNHQATRLLPAIVISDRVDGTSVRAVRPLAPKAYLKKPYSLNSAGQHNGAVCKTLGQALPRLGVKRALNLTLQLAVQNNATLSDPRLKHQAASSAEYAQRAAELAHWLASRLKLDTELSYTAGLLHNIGELALLRSLQEWLDSGGELAEDEIHCALRERSASFGSALRAQWRLPLGLRQLIAAFYSLGAEVFTREALVLNVTGSLLRLPPSSPIDALLQDRAVRLLRLDEAILERAPRERA